MGGFALDPGREVLGAGADMRVMQRLGLDWKVSVAPMLAEIASGMLEGFLNRGPEDFP